jgi:hypothetical protein
MTYGSATDFFDLSSSPETALNNVTHGNDKKFIIMRVDDRQGATGRGLCTIDHRYEDRKKVGESRGDIGGFG